MHMYEYNEKLLQDIQLHGSDPTLNCKTTQQPRVRIRYLHFIERTTSTPPEGQRLIPIINQRNTTSQV